MKIVEGSKHDVLVTISVLAVLILMLLGEKSNAQQCGSQVDFKYNCSQGYCCSNAGWCGTTDPYCAPGNCQSQCPTPSPPPPPPAPAPPSPIKDYFTEEMFNEMFKNRDDSRCSPGFFTYSAFITAANTFPEFGNTGDLETRKRELAAFFAQTSQETYGGWPGAPGGQYSWGYCFKAEIGGGVLCENSAQWPCCPGKSYYGRGPMQISYNYNYGPAGEALNLDLLCNPDLVETDSVISFRTAIWFWMTPQYPKPSCHDVITGKWVPTPKDIAAGRVPGYGVLINIINGGLECNIPAPDNRVTNRIEFYKRYCTEIFNIPVGDNLDCYHQCNFRDCPPGPALVGTFSSA
ncbi:unnamed protein product [Amaranthus hypochondriacus]